MPAHTSSVDNKAAGLDDLPYAGGLQSPDLIEMDQRQRIFEEVIISRIKVVQDFVKNRYTKLNQSVKDLKQNSLLAGASMHPD